MSFRRKIFIGFYLFIWVLFLIVIYAYQTDKYYEITQFIAPFLFFFVLIISVVVILSFAIRLKLKGERKDKKALIISVFPFIFLLPLGYNYLQLDKLQETEQTVELSYIAWACDCADWVIPEHAKKYYDNINDTLAKLSMYIEPENDKLKLPDSFYVSGNKIKFTGKFYKEKKFPKHYFSAELPGRAKVFRYTKYEIVKPFYVWTVTHPDSASTTVELK